MSFSSSSSSASSSSSPAPLRLRSPSLSPSQSVSLPLSPLPPSSPSLSALSTPSAASGSIVSHSVDWATILGPRNGVGSVPASVKQTGRRSKKRPSTARQQESDMGHCNEQNGTSEQISESDGRHFRSRSKENQAVKHTGKKRKSSKPPVPGSEQYSLIMRSVLSALLSVGGGLAHQDGDTDDWFIDIRTIYLHASEMIRTVQRMGEQDGKVRGALSVTCAEAGASCASVDEIYNTKADRAKAMQYHIRWRRPNGGITGRVKTSEATAVSILKYVLEHAGHGVDVQIYYSHCAVEKKRTKTRCYVLRQDVLEQMGFVYENARWQSKASSFSVTPPVDGKRGAAGALAGAGTASASAVLSGLRDVDVDAHVASSAAVDSDIAEGEGDERDQDKKSSASDEDGSDAESESEFDEGAERHLDELSEKDECLGLSPVATILAPAPPRPTSSESSLGNGMMQGGEEDSERQDVLPHLKAKHVSRSPSTRNPATLVECIAQMNFYWVLLQPTMEAIVDALRLIPDCSVQCVLTSPPWNLLGLRTSHGYGKQKRVAYDMWEDNVPEHIYQKWQIANLNEYHRIIKPDGVILYNHRDRRVNRKVHRPTDFILRSRCNDQGTIILQHPSTHNQAMNIPETHEYVYLLTKDQKAHYWQKHPGSQLNRGSVIRTRSAAAVKKGIDHPCPLDEHIVEMLIKNATKEGDIVLDPFAGSGSTLLVAERLGRKFMGFDVSDKYRAVWLQRAQTQRKRCMTT